MTHGIIAGRLACGFRPAKSREIRHRVDASELHLLWKGHLMAESRAIRDTGAVQSSPATGAATVAAAHPARYLLRARDLVDAGYAEPLDVADLAREAGLSRAHFSAEFRRAFGESPHVYLLTRRLERAAALLRTTDHSVADICMSVGLSSVGSFTTSFRRMFGLPPTAYRASHPPASLLARIPACVVHAYSRPKNRTFREDDGELPSVALASSSTTNEAQDGGNDVQDRQRATMGARSG
jgi:AraC-like DNA-binding protein